VQSAGAAAAGERRRLRVRHRAGHPLGVCTPCLKSVPLCSRTGGCRLAVTVMAVHLRVPIPLSHTPSCGCGLREMDMRAPNDGAA